jgi:UDP-N-acetylmuramate dehydrogenase
MITINELPKIRGKYRFNAKITNWFDVGGNAEVLFRPKDLEDLEFFLQNINQKISCQILGAGSNVIISDEGVKGVLIRLGSEFANIKFEENDQQFFIRSGAGCLAVNVANFAKNLGLSGLEFLSGIPGSIGGVIAMNAGCYGQDISQVLCEVDSLDYQGKKHKLKNHQFNFEYRSNKLIDKYIFTEVLLKVEKSSILEVSKKMIEMQNQRENSQPIRAKTGGSTFKNPVNKKAWELIDAIGFRGKQKGGAQFSNKHCNFLINNNSAKASDLIDLANEAKNEVQKKFSINLEWEIKIIK